jgi:hypothetical protein
LAEVAPEERFWLSRPCANVGFDRLPGELFDVSVTAPQSQHQDDEEKG